MAVFFGYTNAVFGTQSTIDGAAHNYAFAPTNGSTWQYSGPDTYFVVEENDGASNFNGDPTNEVVSNQERVGANWQQITEIDGTASSLIYDYTFTVTDGITTWRVSVIDVDLDNDNSLDGSEDGYYLIFPDGMPPADTDLTTGPISDNSTSIAHASLGGSVVCFAAGTLIETDTGPRRIETLKPDDLVLTREDGLQPLRWIGEAKVPATGNLAPIVITAGTFGNTCDLVVSPQHCILLTDWRAELLFGQNEVLVRAVDLLGHDGVYRRTGGWAHYVHILFDAHQAVLTPGLWSESLYPGEVALKTVAPQARDEICRLLGDLQDYGPKFAPCLRQFEAECLHAMTTANP